MTCKLLGALALAALAGSASAEIAQFAGSYVVDAQTGQTTFSSRAGFSVYNSTAGAVAGGISSSTLSTTWGDNCGITQTGTLEEFTFAVFNSTSGGNTGSILTANYSFDFRRFVANTSMGSFTGSVNFGTGLNAGFYSTITFVNLSTLAIPVVLDTLNMEVRQQRTSQTGTSTRQGVVFTSAGTTVGTDLAPTAFYKNDSASPPAGYYNLTGTPPPNVALLYNLKVLPAPGSLALLGVGGLIAGRRRR